MANPKKFIDAGVKALTPAQMKAEMAVSRARDVLPKAEREVNLQQYMQGAAISDRLYHATTATQGGKGEEALRTLKPSKEGSLGSGIYMHPSPEYVDEYAQGLGGNILPLYTNIKNPLYINHRDSKDPMKDALIKLGVEPNKADAIVERAYENKGYIGKEVQSRAQAAGYDGLIQLDPQTGKMGEVVSYNPNSVKSAIGNTGEYNPYGGDLGMARGGIIKMGKGGLGRKAADKILPKVEAPSVMTRSEISDLADYIKNREGGYGLRRVERAADEIPRLGEMYTQDALRSAFSGDNARALMTMNPADFEKYATPLDPYFLKSTAYRSSDDSKMGHEDYIKHLEDIQARGGFKDVPFFEINKEEQGLPLLPFISGHEGRHRSRAMTSAGENAGLVQLLPRSELREPFPRRSQEDYIEALKREMAITGNKVLPQTYTEPKPNSFDDTVIRRPAIDLPDLYAKGGAVKMAEGGDPERTKYDQMIHDQTQAKFDAQRFLKENPNSDRQPTGAPTLDQQRLELMNAPVIQATPQTPLQYGIGTLGGYMDQAGQFVSKSIDPIRESSPVKSFIGELILADTLKSAGTAMQDYTKTSRDYTEDNPYKRAPITGSGQTMSLDPRMLDVIGFADPVARLGIKAGKAGVKAATPFAKDVGQMASEMYMRGDIPLMTSPNMFAVAPDGKPSKVLAPASDIGFYSPTEAAALNLQRKSGQGQAFLNDIMKGENVKSEEISAMGLDTFLKDKKNVTADEVRDYIAQNKIQLGEARYGKLNDQQMMAEWNKIAMKDYGKPYNELDHNEAVSVERYANQDTSKFKGYALSGGENYREIVLTLPSDVDSLAKRQLDIEKLLESADLTNQERSGLRLEYKKAADKIRGANTYQSSHWDEANPLSHLRVSDRVTDGKKTLLVDEVQSDWHQAGREQGYVDPNKKPFTVEADQYGVYRIKDANGQTFSPYVDGDQMSGFMTREAAENAMQNNMTRLPKSQGVPDAPYKDDWYQLTLRRAIKEAVDGGYDRVALPTGSRVAERFDLSKQIDRIDYNKNDDGTYSMSAIKGGKQVFAKEGLDENELSGIVGKDVAKKMVGDEGAAQYDADIADELGVGVVKSLTGLDLSVGGKGMKKYYDEIYPSYLNKLGKKYGSSVGKTTVDVDGKPEPLHFMEITPAMRKEFSTGIHMKRGGKVQFAKSLDAMRHELTKAK